MIWTLLYVRWYLCISCNLKLGGRLERFLFVGKQFECFGDAIVSENCKLVCVSCINSVDGFCHCCYSLSGGIGWNCWIRVICFAQFFLTGKVVFSVIHLIGVIAVPYNEYLFWVGVVGNIYVIIIKPIWLFNGDIFHNISDIADVVAFD